MKATVLPIHAGIEAERLASMHRKIKEGIERVQLRADTLAQRLPPGTAAANIDNVVDEGFKDLRAIEAGYLALTGRKL